MFVLLLNLLWALNLFLFLFLLVPIISFKVLSHKLFFRGDSVFKTFLTILITLNLESPSSPSSPSSLSFSSLFPFVYYSYGYTWRKGGKKVFCKPIFKLLFKARLSILDWIPTLLIHRKMASRKEHAWWGKYKSGDIDETSLLCNLIF